MNPDIKTWLYDILQSIKEIESYYADRPRIFDEYQKDIRTKRAIERNIEIIGEAVNRILKEDTDFQINDALHIVGTRNRIIHGYDRVSDDMIWSIVINHLPKLKIEVEGLLNE
jgi:uncharacterized protein with HEPN domain